MILVDVYRKHATTLVCGRKKKFLVGASRRKSAQVGASRRKSSQVGASRRKSAQIGASRPFSVPPFCSYSSLQRFVEQAAWRPLMRVLHIFFCI
jgi:hypothetical protein